MENQNQGQSLSGKINHLIALAEDGKQGYENAAKDVKDEGLKSTFLRLSGERDGYITELQQQLREIGNEEPAGTGGPLGALHRTWIDIKAALTSGDRNAIIKECITGEEYALKEYATVLDAIKGASPLRQVLVRQQNGINSAVNGLKTQLDKK